MSYYNDDLNGEEERRKVMSIRREHTPKGRDRKDYADRTFTYDAQELSTLDMSHSGESLQITTRSKDGIRTVITFGWAAAEQLMTASQETFPALQAHRDQKEQERQAEVQKQDNLKKRKRELAKICEQVTGIRLGTLSGAVDEIEIEKYGRELRVTNLPVKKLDIFCINCEVTYNIQNKATKAGKLFTRCLTHEISAPPECEVWLTSGKRSGEVCGAFAPNKRRRSNGDRVMVCHRHREKFKDWEKPQTTTPTSS